MLNSPSIAPETPRRTPRRKALFAAVAVCITLFALLLVGEIALRAKAAIETRRIRQALSLGSGGTSWAVYDPDLNYRNRPNWGDHNADGMRDRPTPPKMQFRILMLGDSIGYYGDSIDD